MRKFEIWTIAGGEHTSKPRPCVIVQSDVIPLFDTVIIAPITSFDLPNSAYRIFVAPTSETGLLNDSFVEVEKLGAVKKKFLGKRLGNIPETSFESIDKAISELLDIKG